jgi:hypothetical protein
LCHVLWTVNAACTKGGVVRLHNLHEWVLENPHTTKRFSFQQTFSVSVQVRIIYGWLPNWTIHGSELSQWNPVCRFP